MRSEKIFVINRETRNREEEHIEGEWGLRLLYHPRLSLISPLRRLLTGHAFFSRLMGWWNNRSFSARKIKPFIQRHALDQTIFEKTTFRTFNEFFTRKLHPSARPIANGPIIMPADGRYLVYENFRKAQEVVIKGQKFSLHELLGRDDKRTQQYLDGSMVIARLAPCDYHRFHFPVEGIASAPHFINGPLNSVNPIALQRYLRTLAENKRAFVSIQTPQCGEVLIIAVGALFVGSIHYTFEAGKAVRCGDEMGYFSFGGSTLIVLFEPNRVQFANDLLTNTLHNIETLCRMGTKLGICCEN